MSNKAPSTSAEQLPIPFHPRTWIKDLAFLDYRPLKEIVIPGSHDAGTYKLDNPIYNNSSQCQQISVLEQLRAGSRYLDLRAWRGLDHEYWMYHGGAWGAIKLIDVLNDLKTFLAESSEEIVIATLLIGNEPNSNEGWDWACKQVQAHRVTPVELEGELKGKRIADVTPNDLRFVGKRLVFLRFGDAEQLACMDREGVYGNSQSPKVYLEKLGAYRINPKLMWILHLGIPWKGDTHNTMDVRAGWNAATFMPRLKGESPYKSWRTRRLNIINVDFVEAFGWVDAIIKLNYHHPKTWPRLEAQKA